MESRNKNVLECQNVSISFGGLDAVKNFNLDVRQGELVGLIGPNGAGKTTVFNMLSGLYTPTSGEIILDGESIKGLSPDKLARKGVARTFQNIRLFDYLSVLDNVKVAMNMDMTYSKFSGMFRTGAYRGQEGDKSDEAMEILKVLGLDRYADWRSSALPYGAQRKLEIARALASDPKLLLLDEPAAGMNTVETEELMQTISLIRDKYSLAVVLIEHDMNLVLGICEFLMVLNHGETLAFGQPKEVVSQKEVVEAYLGSGGGR